MLVLSFFFFIYLFLAAWCFPFAFLVVVAGQSVVEVQASFVRCLLVAEPAFLECGLRNCGPQA